MKLEPDFFFTLERHRAARQGGKERQRDFAIRRGTMSVKLGLRAEFSLRFFSPPPLPGFLSSVLSFHHQKVQRQNSCDPKMLMWQ